VIRSAGLGDYSTRWLTGVVEMMSSGNYGLTPTMAVYDMTFTVNSTI